ncbi:phage capsid scaffolding protein [Klebsiella pneumoniae]|nr:phage capsid scaffolding protein [Klebsiella pneumoniae]
MVSKIFFLSVSFGINLFPVRYQFISRAIAVTDDPASLGTEYLEFCRGAKFNPLNRFKTDPGNLISVATLAELEFEDQAENVFTALSDKVKAIFSRKQASDDARFQDVHEAVTTVSEHVQENLTATEQRLASLENAFATGFVE